MKRVFDSDFGAGSYTPNWSQHQQHFLPPQEAYRRSLISIIETMLKLIVSGLTGMGVGMLTFRLSVMIQGEHALHRIESTPGLFIGVGAGLLTMALSMVVLFVSPLGRWSWLASYHDAPKPAPKRAVY